MVLKKNIYLIKHFLLTMQTSTVDSLFKLRIYQWDWIIHPNNPSLYTKKDNTHPPFLPVCIPSQFIKLVIK